jgi:hypothetical protein
LPLGHISNMSVSQYFSWLSVGGELELLAVATLSHQWHHPDGFPALSVFDGKERLLMVREEMRDEWCRPVVDRNVHTYVSYLAGMNGGADIKEGCGCSSAEFALHSGIRGRLMRLALRGFPFTATAPSLGRRRLTVVRVSLRVGPATLRLASCCVRRV